MIRIIFGDVFVKTSKRLPKNLHRKLVELIKILENNPFNPLLHSKQLSGNLAGFYSFRITREYRALFQFIEAEVVKLEKIGHRKDIYKR